MPPREPRSGVTASEGVPAMLLGYLLLGLQPMFVKLASHEGFSPALSVLVRFAITLGLALLTARWLGQSLKTHRPGIWVLRGVLGGAAVLFYFTSVSFAGAGVGTLLNYTYPIWAQLFAFTIGERLRFESWLYLLVALLGMFLIVDPRGAALGIGELAGILSGMLAGGGVLCVKKLRETDGEQTVIVSFSVFGLLYGVGLLFWPDSPFALPAPLASGRTTRGWLIEGVVGLLSFLGHVYFTKGYKNTTIRLGSILSLLVPLLATATGAVFLGERLTPSFTLGALLILGSVLVASFRERPRRT